MTAKNFQKYFFLSYFEVWAWYAPRRSSKVNVEIFQQRKRFINVLSFSISFFSSAFVLSPSYCVVACAVARTVT